MPTETVKQKKEKAMSAIWCGDVFWRVPQPQS